MIERITSGLLRRLPFILPVVGATAIGFAVAETIDTGTQRHGMHCCPVGEFVVGVHAGQNRLLCAPGDGDFSQETVDTSTIDAGMHACPGGWTMTGIHVDNNLLACTPMTSPMAGRMVDPDTVRLGMHACPIGSYATGIHVGNNLLLCSGMAGGGEIVDSGTVRNGMHSCPIGAFISGFHVGNNLLLCTTANVDASTEFVDSGTVSHHMHACPEGMVATGIHVGNNLLACAKLDAALIPRVVDTSTSRRGMHACPPGLPVSGLHVGENLALCGDQYVLRIKSFEARPSTITKGEKTILSWDVICTAPDCATRIEGGTLVKRGLKTADTLEDSPGQDTTYRLISESGGGSDSSTTSIALRRFRFCFRRTSDSTIEPCAIVEIEAPDVESATAAAQSQCTNCTITKVGCGERCP